MVICDKCGKSAYSNYMMYTDKKEKNEIIICEDCGKEQIPFGIEFIKAFCRGATVEQIKAINASNK